MASVYIICEGRTESAIVKNILAPGFAVKGAYLHPVRIGRRRRGGNVTFDRLELNIRDQLYNNRSAYCTTFVDFYGIDGDFPGKKEAVGKSSLSDKQAVVCDAFSDALSQRLDEGPMLRFIPYVQMHEFEALLFSDPARFSTGISQPDLHAKFHGISSRFATPEHINDSPKTAPSKQVIEVFPGYERQKPLLGVLAALEIGLPKIRQECPLFNAWLAKLENLPPLLA